MTTPASDSGPRRRALLAATALATVGVGAAQPRAVAAPAARRVRPPRVRLTLPAPTGPYPVGTVSHRLVDHDRPDPWVASRPSRELMVSVRYPARDVERYPRAAQMSPGEAAGFDRLNNFGGVPRGSVDWAATRTFAHQGAPPARTRRGAAHPRVHPEVHPVARPVVLYSPGVGDPRSLGTTLTDELASRGYVVVCVDHTYDASAVEFPDGRIETTRLPEEYERAEREGTVVELLRKTCAVRVADLRFVLDRLEAIVPAPFAPSVIGAFGQSAGGFAALQTMHDDRRIAAAANLDGLLAYVQEDQDPGPLSTVAADGVDRPVLLMGKDGNDHHTVPSWGALWEHGSGPRLDLTLLGSGHASYTDATSMLPRIAERLGLPKEVVTGAIGTVAPERAVAVQRAYVPAFFDRELRHRDDAGLLDGPSARYPELRFVG
ncbi:alpha/beta hydrolase family protein [Streptomyces rapamycinicus]|uniref:Hydrolase n=2 Tax=Streptomyces rapamycinicus TaxID=1226757 RepID=A0A0A0NRJ3_STRRN|nr:lipase [Streptomyces rapamycinicus]AGP57190.1 lipase [Streptomyces rapamycinicus NRRL 5491]MBB4784832.1 putative dienelactone hydrolase [Streptomyces rapamycinicus]RLV79691.1 hydrolase [Streptomyces rapamycinicus NRRL 5491]UTO65086.1 hydrolase [Streptomyces rapamycinicus]UTP33042.1 hydrolase [Streptomyces rapamycinicus NRRL 5491]